MALQYSPEGLLNRAIFFPTNTLHFFVEDSAEAYMYEIIIKRLLGDKIFIQQVFGCGGKTPLIETYKKYKEKSSLQKNYLFIADADFDLLLDRNVIKDCYFIYLERYCIENYLIDEDAVVTAIQPNLRLLREEVKKKLQFSWWYSEATSQLFPLAMLFAIIMKNGLNIEFERIQKHLCDHGWEVDKSKVRLFRESVKIELTKKGKKLRTEERGIRVLVTKRYAKCKEGCISGKYYLTCLRRYLTSVTDSQTNEDYLKGSLLNHCDTSSLNFLKKRILELVEA